MNQDLAELLAKLAEERARFLAEAEKVTEDEAIRPQQEGEWSIKQQLAHMYGMEQTYRHWTQLCCQEDYPELGPLPSVAVHYEAEQANTRTVGQWLSLLNQERQKTIDLAYRINAEQWQCQGKNTTFGDLTVLQIMRSFYRHDRMHADQIAGRPSLYVPRTVDGRRL